MLKLRRRRLCLGGDSSLVDLRVQMRRSVVLVCGRGLLCVGFEEEMKAKKQDQGLECEGG